MALVLLCKKILLTSDLKCQQRGVICLLLFPHFRICGGKSLFSGLKCGLSIPLCLPAGRGVLFCGFKLCLCLLKSSKSLLIFLPGILQFRNLIFRGLRIALCRIQCLLRVGHGFFCLLVDSLCPVVCLKACGEPVLSLFQFSPGAVQIGQLFRSICTVKLKVAPCLIDFSLGLGDIFPACLNDVFDMASPEVHISLSFSKLLQFCGCLVAFLLCFDVVSLHVFPVERVEQLLCKSASFKCSMIRLADGMSADKRDEAEGVAFSAAVVIS